MLVFVEKRKNTKPVARLRYAPVAEVLNVEPMTPLTAKELNMYEIANCKNKFYEEGDYLHPSTVREGVPIRPSLEAFSSLSASPRAIVTSLRLV